MAIHPVHQLILKGEGETLDFKKTISSASKIAKTISAFANHKGGTLLVGVTDQKKICGVRSEEEKYMLDLAAHFYVKPEIDLEIKAWEINGTTVLEAIVPEGKDKPYYAKDENGDWWVHIRVKDQSLLASKIVVEVLRRNQQKKPNLIRYTQHEQSVLKYLEQHNKATLKEFCKLLNISRWRAQRMLIALVSAGVVRAHTTEKTEFFTLS